MIYDNNATRTRRDLLIRIARLTYDNRLQSNIDRIPILIRPKNDTSLRCCIYKDRAVLRYRLMVNLGFRIENETDELVPLSEYAQQCLDRPDGRSVEPVLTLIEEACSSCVQAKYFVTNACRGCVARPCTLNCPKKAISIGAQGQAQINPELCVNCGLCLKVCPYHSIIRIPVPCEEACPVQAIEKKGSGKAHIDFDKCIYCGKCMRECPFGAIMETSQMVELIDIIRSKKQKVAVMIAPAVAGQFVAEFGQLVTALIKLGFETVIEVAQGAQTTALNEAQELRHRLAEGAPFMTTSCCPSYVQAVKKHVPALMDKVSATPTPLHYTAEYAAKEYPDFVRVFVSPCIAKRQEANGDDLVDYVITCEELGAMFAAKNIDVADCAHTEINSTASGCGRGFPLSGGVTAAVKQYLENPDIVKPQIVNGLTRQSIKLLKIYGTKGIAPNNFLEVMACEGGCVNGPCTMENPALAARRINDLMNKSSRPESGV